MAEFAVTSRGLAAAAGLVLLCSAAPASAQQAMMPGPLPTPIMAPTPKTFDKPPEVKLADTHVESTRLGYDKGIGPAVGRTVTWRGREYEVTDVAVIGGGPSFCGGSKFVIAPEGRGLMIGLKEVDTETVAVLAVSTKKAVN